MSDTIDLSALGGQIPPHRVFKVVTKRSELVATGDSHYHSAGEEMTVMAHIMTVAEETGVLVFYTWRLETLEIDGKPQPVVVQSCTDAFAKWDEAHEVQMPAVKAGKAH